MQKLRALDPARFAVLDRYDVFLSALGFEERCIHAAKEYGSLADRKIAGGFEDRHVLAFRSNQDWLLANGFEVHPSMASLSGSFSAVMEHDDSISSAMIDVSSMTRPMIAEVLRELVRVRSGVRVDFVYSPAQFTSPVGMPPPQTSSQPVSPRLAGWSMPPDLPLAAIIGVGYEYGRALGILEYLEPQSAWLFKPQGVDDSYDAAVDRVNTRLLDLVPLSQQIDYLVANPFNCFERLEALVYGLNGLARPLIAPFGPKLFSLVSMLVAELHFPSVTVWRVSGGASEVPLPHPALGPIYRLPVYFGESGSA